MEYRYQVGDEIKTIVVERNGDEYRVTIGDQTYKVNIFRAADGVFDFAVDGKSQRVYVANDGERSYVASDANIAVLSKVTALAAQRRKTASAGDNSLTAAMPGQVIKVLVADGDMVTKGQTLVILEAMKMEIRVAGPTDGQVRKVLVSTGQIVERGQHLLDWESHSA